MRIIFFLSMGSFLTTASAAQAQSEDVVISDIAGSADAENSSPQENREKKYKQKLPRNSLKPFKRRDLGEKEAEGTEAPKRFNPDINIKSKYEFHGQPIEVDTD